MSKDKMKLSLFLNYIDTDMYVELYTGDTSVTGLLYEGILKNLLSDKDSYQEYLDMMVDMEGVSIDPPLTLCILLHTE